MPYKEEQETEKPIEEKKERGKPGQRSSSRRPRTFSIANHGVSITTVDEDEKEENDEPQQKDKKRNNNFTEEALIEAWKEYTETLSEERLLKNTMSLYLPKKVNDVVFEVTVNTDINKEYLDNNIRSILDWLQDKLKNDFIEMKIVISKVIVNNKPFTSQEIFQEMARQNPALNKLKDELGLEIK